MAVIISEVVSEVVVDPEAPFIDSRQGGDTLDPHEIMMLMKRAERRQMRLQAD